MSNPELSSKAGQALGLPPGFKTYSPFPFKGVNLQDAPHAIEDQEFVWIENFVRNGNGSLRTLWDKGSSVYTAPTGLTIVYFSFYTLGTSYYCAIFLSDGSAIQLDMASSAQTTIGPAGAFYDPTQPENLPYCKQWGSIYLLICNRTTTNDYWVWDGINLYTSGTAAPEGVNLQSVGFSYSTNPTITAYGGSGSGMTFSSLISDGAISQINILTPGSGYNPGDVVQLQFSGGGSDSSAVLQAVLSSGSVGGVSITAAGSGYTSATVSFSGGGGSGASGNVVIGTGSVTGTTNLIGGGGYTSSPAVGFSGGGGSGATATATVVGGIVVNVEIINGGSGYTSPPAISFTGGGGSGASATATVTGIGTIVGVNLTSVGTGYTTAPTVNISGTGSGATAQAVLAPTGVASVIVVNGGSGFTSVPLLTIEGGGGAGATAVAVLTGTSVAAINVTAGGSYASAPNISFTGGGNNPTLPTATCVMDGLQVVAINITSAGSNITGPVTAVFGTSVGSGAGANVVLKGTSIASVIVSSVGQYYNSAPAVVVGASGNNAAYATVALMPYGVSGSAMETYLSRVWIINPAPQQQGNIPPGNLWNFSAPGSISDFATSDGGGNAINTDAFLQTRYVNVRQSSGYLYFFGDGSVSVVSNVNTAGTPAVTTYNYQNVDPQAGLKYRDSIQDFGKSIVVSNETGIYAVFGGSLANISTKLAQLFTNVVFPESGGLTPTSATATIYDIKYYVNYLTVKDPITGATRNVMLLYNEKDWTIASQSANLTFIGTQKVSSKYKAWGTDGTNLYPLFDTPSATLQKRINTKQYGAQHMFIQKQALAVYMQATDNSSNSAGVNGNFSLSISGIALQNAFQPSLQSGTYNVSLVQPNFQSPSPYYGFWGASLEGAGFVMAGLQFTSTSPDFTLGHLLMGYSEVVASY